ncbi:5'-nucleotidase C-terminal domain-containing protein [Sulfurimonas sp. MAG313]|nr:5'-nucleotidase C-terminal domain-containing protein [Sulfurimonas sp. MAG313]MDF1880774.1 5'-nucleotidase C-terminal domain-containing protein [Sulfurimonas sp. MAG313]
MNKTILSISFVVLFTVGSIFFYALKIKPQSQEVFISFAHIGDIHAHLLPRIHIRDGEKRQMQGGLAQLYTLIKHLRERDSELILINTGDTIEGSAEALFTRGEALVKVLNTFGINYYAPGNGDWLYGKERFKELFVGEEALAHWNPLIANMYDAQTNKHLTKPYEIKTIKGIKIGFLGFTGVRGPTGLTDSVMDGLKLTNGEEEFKKYVKELRPQVQVLVVLSELGLAKNIAYAKETPGVDFIFSSGMREETPQAIQLKNGTVIMEEGTDGTRLGELNILIKKGKLFGHKFKMHIIDRNIPQNAEVAALIKEIRAPFIDPEKSKNFINPFSKRHLQGPIDAVIGQAQVELTRSNYSNAKMPAVVEGSSHDFLADAFREQAKADIGLVRGFRYGTNVKKGDIHREDIYHFIPSGPFIARGEMSGEKIKNILENSAQESLAKSSKSWKGAWLFAWSGLHFNLNYYDLKGARITNITVFDKKTSTYLPLDMNKLYTVASYNYKEEPSLINKIKASNIRRVQNDKGEDIDATEVVEAYLKKHTANPELNRITLDNMLPTLKYKNPEIQTLP